MVRSWGSDSSPTASAVFSQIQVLFLLGWSYEQVRRLHFEAVIATKADRRPSWTAFFLVPPFSVRSHGSSLFYLRWGRYGIIGTTSFDPLIEDAAGLIYGTSGGRPTVILDALAIGDRRDLDEEAADFVPSCTQVSVFFGSRILAKSFATRTLSCGSTDKWRRARASDSP